MTQQNTTLPTADDKPKTHEVIRFGLGSTPMPLARMRAILEAVETPDNATIRIYNGSAIIEAPAPAPEADPK